MLPRPVVQSIDINVSTNQTRRNDCRREPVMTVVAGYMAAVVSQIVGFTYDGQVGSSGLSACTMRHLDKSGGRMLLLMSQRHWVACITYPNVAMQ